MREYVAQINGELDWHNNENLITGFKIGYGNSNFYINTDKAKETDLNLFDTKFKDRYNEIYGTNY